MVTFATALAARGLDVVTFNFLYTEQGKVERTYSELQDRIVEWAAALSSAVGRSRLSISGCYLGRQRRYLQPGI